ncbi:hypothetical protein LLH06_16690 [Mucilaginibacter daejeonensis]|nr:hypothetical protein [Mucilaginibacter daejeonensis]UEG52594.1 hypothetical protein LLH06_16690 [Mucilaginibacter daejeonensis]
MNVFGGWDAIIDPFFTTLWDNFAVTLIVMLTLYWILVFLILWVIIGFLD